MGCDIHLYVEKLDPETGAWVEIFDEPHVMYFYPDTMDQPAMTEEWYWGRNYDLFAFLADVRNGFGFAGIPTGERITPLFEQLGENHLRGLPEDLSDTVKGHWGSGWDTEDYCDGHSHQWYTLRELVHADMSQRRKKTGVVSVNQYREFLATGSPSSWSGGVSGPGIEHVTNEQMDLLILQGKADAEGPFGAKYYTQITWDTVLGEHSIGDDWREFLERAGKHTLDDGTDVRVVFWFDN